MPFATPQFTRGQVDNAGGLLVANGVVWTVERDQALAVINNWRSSHSYPLRAIKMTLRDRALKIDPKSIVAQRLKRISSISTKLHRNENMKLSQIQDIGGCRAIIGTTESVDALVEVYERSISRNPKAGPEFVKRYDYIANPKEDGYRGLHYVYKYRTESRSHEGWNGLRIEIQIRSALQHAWATAVETVDTFTAQSIKTGGGIARWKRFFVLMASAIAVQEKRAAVPGAPTSRRDLRDELIAMVAELQVQTLLSGWSAAVQFFPTRVAPGDKTFLLHLDLEERVIRVRGFADEATAKASDQYLAAEMQQMSESVGKSQAVLVAVDSALSLQRAFPNYYADTAAFINAVNAAIL